MSEELRRKIEIGVLPRVRRPGRYAGGELHSVEKPAADVRLALCFPEMYEIGMSNYGFMLLYHLVNDLDWASCERSFAPWPDMEAALRAAALPLYSLETFTPLADFDVVGFSLSYEMTYVNVLTMLDLAGLPFRAAHRTGKHPLVIAGGCGTANPEPVAVFFDAIVVGEGEEILVELLEVVRAAKKEGAGREETLGRLAELDGVYVPLFRETIENPDGLVTVGGARRGKLPVRRRFVADLGNSYMPDRCMVPTLEAVHDRINMELFRGCVQGCRYCQAGMIYRPHRERPAERLAAAAEEMYRATGWEEISLLSLNAPDYAGLGRLLDGLAGFTAEEKVSISMPSTRADTFDGDVGEKLRAVRGTGLTLAPEAGAQRLRDAINKRITEEDIVRALRSSFSAGWRKVKLYFMIGLPTETREDVQEIIGLIERLSGVAREFKGKSRGRGSKSSDFTLSVSNFVPKPHTPFQWEPMNMVSVLREKQEFLREGLRPYHVKLDLHDPEMSFLETVFSRGDRRLGAVIEAAWRLGARLDGWMEQFKPDLWKEAFAAAGIDPERYAYSAYTPGAPLPWSHIASGISEKFLLLERQKAFRSETTESCQRGGCAGCGLCEKNAGSGLDFGHISKSTSTETPGPKVQSPDLTPPLRVMYEAVFARRWEARFLSHLDVMRALSRALRRSGLPIYYSEGFNPKPKLSYLTPPLSVGHTSECERFRFQLLENIEINDVAAALGKSLPPGMALEKISAPAPGEPKKSGGAIECFALLLDPEGGGISTESEIEYPPAVADVSSGAGGVKMISRADAQGLTLLSDPVDNRRFLEKHFIAGAVFLQKTGEGAMRPADFVEELPAFAGAAAPVCFHRKREIYSTSPAGIK